MTSKKDLDDCLDQIKNFNKPMKITITNKNCLSIEELPSYIYLIDLILKEEIENLSYYAIANKISKIIEEEEKFYINYRTIVRAFNLRENLKFRKIVAVDYKIPSRKILNLLTSYYFEKSIKDFIKFSQDYKNEILLHYNDNKPSDETLKLIFNIIELPIRNTNKTKIFISYSHKDKKWLDLVLRDIKVLQLENKSIEVWDDTKILPGKKWEKEIEHALESAKISILLISSNFLASDFIMNSELPKLLLNAEKHGTKVLPIILGYCRFNRNKDLCKFQALNDPGMPLSILSDSEVDKTLVEMTDTIEEFLNN
ncbi:toll/interleukin-1 receptor domain-containing protein [Flavivirga aquimarina]|uniref:Toll/interleukin-1 receptor domain-containing protein n=1 Tax=Flavivirga aquimarina TaxID=2027862 RepID=A0ABT8WDC8_9FLAO|nr:toll/interleukin-1 receptor domain-containing protein [Flavivirga aquimarina]MDO5971049.1 toll/interleukin-1 receptor domain-containing protein [Flavivirga aquimarina]